MTDLEGLGEPTAFAKVTNDALKFCETKLIPLEHPIVEHRYHTSVGISKGADFRMQVRFLRPARNCNDSAKKNISSLR